MMRKDVKIGFVVGGILVAVLIAVALVSGPKKTPQNGAELVGSGTPLDQQTNPQEAPPSPADASAARSAEGAAPAPAGNKPGDPFTPTGSGSTALAQNEPKKADGTAEDKWMLALNNGVAPMMTTTPGAAGSAKNPAPAGAEEKAGKSSQPPVSAELAAHTTTLSDPPTKNLTSTNPPATQPTGSASSNGPRTHVVQSGETIVKIAEAVYGSQNYWPHIVRANPGIVAEKLRPGTTLVLPPISEVRGTSGAPVETNTPASLSRTPDVDPKTQYVVQSGDSLNKISVKLYGNTAKWEAIYALNKDQIGPDPAKLKLHSVLKLPEPPSVR